MTFEWPSWSESSRPFALPFPWVSQYISVLQLLYCCTFTSSWMALHFVLVQYTNGFISSYCSGISGTMFLHCMARCWLLLVLLLQVDTTSKVTGMLPSDNWPYVTRVPAGRRPIVLAPGDDSEAEVQHGVDQTAPGRQSLISHHLNFKMLRIFWWAIEGLSQALIFIFH